MSPISYFSPITFFFQDPLIPVSLETIIFKLVNTAFGYLEDRKEKRGLEGKSISLRLPIIDETATYIIVGILVGLTVIVFTVIFCRMNCSGDTSDNDKTPLLEVIDN